MDIFLPLEVVDREYTGRLFVAVAAASKGYNAYFGPKPEITNVALRSQPNNVWFGRGSLSQELHKRGLKIVGQDEEAGIICDRYADFYKLRPGLKTVSFMDRFFCWGHDDYTFLKSKTDGDGNQSRVKIVLSGSPRTITWGSIGKEFYKNEIDRIRDKYGNYILINSNLSHANSFLGNKIFAHLKKMDSWSELEPIVNSAYELETRLLKLYSLAAKEIAKKLNINVVIRPHPTENANTWLNIARPLERVFVETTGPVSPWILASEVVIHNSSTTGIESACANIPTIALGEKAGDLFNGDLTYSNKVSLSALGIANLLAILCDVDVLWKKNEVERKQMLKKKVMNYNNLDSISTIMDNISNIRSVDIIDIGANASAELIRPKRLKEKLTLSNFQKKWTAFKLDRSKRPKLNHVNVMSDITKICKIQSVDCDITCEKMGKDVFVIKRSTS